MAGTIRLERPLSMLSAEGQGGPESVRDALDFGRPQRIGHGVRAFEDPALVDQIAQRGVHLEICPTSNLRLGIVRELHDHPVRRALETEISFSINTDDPGPFACTLTSELRLVRDAFELPEAELELISSRARRAAFEPRGS